MKIAIEAQRIFRVNKHGMDFVALECIRQLQRLDKINEYFIFVAPGKDHCLESTFNFHVIELHSSFYPFWEQIALPFAAKKVKANILHCTSNTAPIYCKVPIIITLHDIIFLEKQRGKNTSLYQKLGWYYRKLVVPKAIKKCKHIITVSNFERKTILDSLNINPNKISTVYNGYSAHFIPISDSLSITKKYFDVEKYIFFLGNTDPKKNTLRILKAYAIYRQNVSTPLPLVIADLKMNIIKKMIEENNLKEIIDYIIPTGYILNVDLPAIYSGARMFIYTSLRESFGIPILESMACGTPVITSDVSAMPETAGDAAYLVNPLDEKDIAKAITEIAEDNDLYEHLSEKCKERSDYFSWKNTAVETLKLYKKKY